MIGIAALLRSFVRAVRRIAQQPEGRGLLALVASLIGGGAVFYRFVEDLSWLDALYFTVVTLATVGYGDIVPTTAAGKVFTALYVLIGVGVLVAFASQVAGSILEMRLDGHKRGEA